MAQIASVEVLWTIIAGSPGRSIFGCLQVLALVATLCRFFLGAYRFHSEAHIQAEREELRDAAWTVMLFNAFYAAALMVAKKEKHGYSVDRLPRGPAFYIRRAGVESATGDRAGVNLMLSESCATIVQFSALTDPSLEDIVAKVIGALRR